MREVSTHTRDVWLSGDYVGQDSRAMVRATIQRLDMLLVPKGRWHYASAIWGQNAWVTELPNIKALTWERAVDTDAATCTLTLYNTAPLPMGNTPPNEYDFGQPGWYTTDRGAKTWSHDRWGYDANLWQGRFVPDRIIRTYEGYGITPEVHADDDPYMYQSGAWFIDDVDYSVEGLITLTCRDAARLLIDQIMFPPVIPFKKYPISFKKKVTVEKKHWEPVEGDSPDNDSTAMGWKRPTYDTDSNVEGGYVSPSGTVYGHHGTDAFDTSTSSYWLSIGNARPNAGYSFEYIQGKMSPRLVSALKFRVWGGPYRCYISVKTASGGWQGNKTVPYDPDNPASAPNGSDIRFLTAVTVDNEELYVHNFGHNHIYDDVVAVRLTFTKLTNSGLGPYPYRAGVRDFKVLADHVPNDDDTHGPDMELVTEDVTHGNYDDYTDIVKKLCALGGLFWPSSWHRATLRKAGIGTPTYIHNPAPSDDPVLGKGRVWGDFMKTGTAGVDDLGPELFDKKPLMDGIKYVQEIVGFNFFIDETGAAVWRLPNLFKKGNYVGDGGPHTGWTTDTEVIDERQILTNLEAKLSSANIRERVFIANSNGRFGAVVKGHNPHHSGLRRVGGWTDQHFKSQAECERMADMITLRQLFTYRTDNVTICGFPGIQIDDQVKIFERVTNEGYRHYVLGISMSWDLETGKYTYTLRTHWLGEEPFGDWVFDPANLQDSTKNYLKAIGVINDNGDGTWSPGDVADPVVFQNP